MPSSCFFIHDVMLTNQAFSIRVEIGGAAMLFSVERCQVSVVPPISARIQIPTTIEFDIMQNSVIIIKLRVTEVRG